MLIVGEEILEELRSDLQVYKNYQSAKGFVIKKKESLIARLEMLLTQNTTLERYNSFKLIEKEINSILHKDSEIGIVQIQIRIKTSKNQIALISI